MEFFRLDYDKGFKKARISCTNRMFGLIRENFSVIDPAAKMMRRMGRGSNIPLKKYVITPAGRYDIGLTSEIFRWLKSKNIEYKVEISDAFKEAYNSKFDFDFNENENLINLNLIPRDYQAKCVKAALKFGNGVFVVPTSGGKTLIIATAIANILARSPKAKIMVVTMTHLVRQFFDDFIDYGIDPSLISMWSGENEFSDTQIVIAGNVIVGSQSKDFTKEAEKLSRQLEVESGKLENGRLSDREYGKISKNCDKIRKSLIHFRNGIAENKTYLKYFKTLDVLFVDEVHQLKKENQITDLCDYIETKHRFGFTGTLPNDMIDVWTVFGKIGPVRAEVNRAELVDSKTIASVDVRFLELQYKGRPKYEEIDFAEPTGMLNNYRIESDFLYTSSFRNRVITSLSAGVSKNILVLVDRIEHGENLKRYIQQAAPGKKVVFISGEMGEDERAEIKDEMEKRNDVVCVAIAKIFSTGISIKNIHYIILGTSYKSRVNTIQTIGRGVRMNPNKSKVVVFDICDMLKYSQKHANERERIYQEEGFSIEHKTIVEK